MWHQESSRTETLPPPGENDPRISSLTSDDESHRLLQGVINGNQRCFEILYGTHYRYVQGLSLRILKSTTEAEEVTQDVFLELWRKPPEIRWGTRSLLAWITVITKTRCWQQMRKKRRLSTHIPLESDHALCNEYKRITSSFLLREMELITSEIDFTHRELFRLMYREGLGATEISRLQAIPVITVRKRMLSLHKKLRQVVHPDAPHQASVAGFHGTA